MANTIGFYKDSQKTQLFVVTYADFAGARFTGSLSSKTIDEVVYKYAEASPNQPGVFPYIADETPLLDHPMIDDVNDTTVTSATYYLKPDMKIELSATNSKSGSTGRTTINAKLSVGETTLINNTETVPRQYCKFYLGKINNERNSVVTTGLGVYRRVTNNTISLTWATDNFWDGSRNPKPVTNSGVKRSTARGGQGAYNWNSAPWTPQKQWSSAQTLNTQPHGLHAYVITDEHLNYLHEGLWSKNIIDQWRNYKFNPIGGVVACHCLPVEVPTQTNPDGFITICGQGFYMGGLTADRTQSCEFVEWQSESIQLDSSEYSETYLDWAPYMKALIKLPFIGWKEIDINTIMDGYFYIHYTIDIINGNCIAEIWVHDRDDHEFCYGGYSGNCAYTIPITANDNGGIAPIKAFMGLAATAVSPVLGAAVTTMAVSDAGNGGVSVKGNTIDAVDGSERSNTETLKNLGSGAINGVTSKHNMYIASDMPANIASMTDDLKIHLVLMNPNNITPMYGDVDQDDILGAPASYVGKVGDFTGLVFGIVHAHPVPKATDQEKSEIESLIAGGVYIGEYTPT